MIGKANKSITNVLMSGGSHSFYREYVKLLLLSWSGLNSLV